MALLTLFSCKKEKPEDPENPEVVLEAIAFESESLEMALGEARQLFVFMFPTDVTDKEVQYDSESPAIVSISETGKATALKEGKAVITAKCGEKEASCTITVTIPVEKIEFSVPSVSMKVNDELKTSVKITPPNATLAKRIEYEIDQAMDKSPIYVELDGASPNNITITAVKTGQETITAKCGGKEAQLFVSVDAVKVTGLSLSSTFITLKAGESQQLTATVSPSNATNKNVSWISNNPKVVSVKNGLVTAHRSGSTNIWAYCGDKGTFCTVEVAPPDGGVDLGLSVFWASVVMVLGFLLSELMPGMCCGIFTNDPELKALAVHGMRIMNCALPIIGFQIVSTNLFQCLGMVKQSVFLSLSRQLIFLLPCLWLLPLRWDIEGVWMSYPVSDVVSFVVTGLMVVYLIKKLKAIEAAKKA